MCFFRFYNPPLWTVIARYPAESECVLDLGKLLLVLHPFASNYLQYRFVEFWKWNRPYNLFGHVYLDSCSLYFLSGLTRTSNTKYNKYVTVVIPAGTWSWHAVLSLTFTVIVYLFVVFCFSRIVQLLLSSFPCKTIFNTFPYQVKM